jgi:hypothetical protein
MLKSLFVYLTKKKSILRFPFGLEFEGDDLLRFPTTICPCIASCIFALTESRLILCLHIRATSSVPVVSPRFCADPTHSTPDLYPRPTFALSSALSNRFSVQPKSWSCRRSRRSTPAVLLTSPGTTLTRPNDRYCPATNSPL